MGLWEGRGCGLERKKGLCKSEGPEEGRSLEIGLGEMGGGVSLNPLFFSGQ